MNALVVAANFQTGVLSALAPALPVPATSAGPTGTSFLDLINVLLGSTVPAAKPLPVLPAGADQSSEHLSTVDLAEPAARGAPSPQPLRNLALSAPIPRPAQVPGGFGQRPKTKIPHGAAEQEQSPAAVLQLSSPMPAPAPIPVLPLPNSPPSQAPLLAPTPGPKAMAALPAPSPNEPAASKMPLSSSIPFAPAKAALPTADATQPTGGMPVVNIKPEAQPLAKTHRLVGADPPSSAPIVTEPPVQHAMRSNPVRTGAPSFEKPTIRATQPQDDSPEPAAELVSPDARNAPRIESAASLPIAFQATLIPIAVTSQPLTERAVQSGPTPKESKIPSVNVPAPENAVRSPAPSGAQFSSLQAAERQGAKPPEAKGQDAKPKTVAEDRNAEARADGRGEPSAIHETANPVRFVPDAVQAESLAATPVVAGVHAAPVASASSEKESSVPVTNAIRNTEPMQPAPPPIAPAPAHDIAIRIAAPNAPSVDLHVSQRAGQVQVAVRTPDSALQTNLRQDLGTLVNSMERAGYHAETFAPRESAVVRTGASEMNSHDGSRDAKSDSSSLFDSGGGGHPREQQNRQNNRPPEDWQNELEKQS